MNKNIKIILGVSGSIAAYKAPEIVRRLREKGCSVKTAMTSAATRFIAPLTFQALTEQNVYLDSVSIPTSFGEKDSNKITHTDMTGEADAMLIAPATADIIAKIAHGFADDPVSVSALCLKKSTPLIIAPAMNPRMWEAEATQKNIEVLRSRKVIFIGPEEGEMACGDFGFGRMSEPEKIVSVTMRALSQSILKQKPLKVLILSGPTRESIDDVRFISNGSSGRMGAALAETIFESGHDVFVITGPAMIQPPQWVETIHIESAQEMLDAARTRDFDILISPAAISDFKPSKKMSGKKSKTEILTLELISTPDVFATLIAEKRKNNPPIKGISFSAEESFDDLERAITKAKAKGADGVVVNSAKESMGSETAKIKFINLDSNNVIEFESLPKKIAAKNIWNIILKM